MHLLFFFNAIDFFYQMVMQKIFKKRNAAQIFFKKKKDKISKKGSQNRVWYRKTKGKKWFNDKKFFFNEKKIIKEHLEINKNTNLIHNYKEDLFLNFILLTYFIDQNYFFSKNN